MNSIADYGDDYEIKKVDYIPFIEAMQLFNERFLSEYRKYVIEHFKEFYEAQPDYFPFMKPIEWKVLFNNRSIDNYLYESDLDAFAAFSNQFNTLGESREFSRLPNFKRTQRINEILGTSNEPLIVIPLKYGYPAPAIIIDKDYVTEDPNDMPSMGEIEGRRFANLHGEKAMSEKHESFNLHGLNELVQKIDSPSFGYELGESVKAYNEGLYLAAASTGGIALENILRILIQRKTDADLPKNTYIKDSLAVLKIKGVLSNRLAASVSSLRDIRNSNSHTNNDPVRKTTVDHLYATIEDLARLL